MHEFNGYFIDEDQHRFGKVLALRSRWSNRYLDVIAKHNVKVIRLSEYNGWLDSNISFLMEIPSIEGLTIVSKKVTNVAPVNELKNLKMLSLTCMAKTPIGFPALRYLKSVFLVWRVAYRSIFAANTMERIDILDYPETDLASWSENISLRELSLSSKKMVSLRGLNRFPNIQILELFKCHKVASLVELARCENLRKLELDKCPNVFDLTPVSNLKDLRELIIDDCGEIQSLAPVANCKKLELLQISGNTNILDGDLSGLSHLPRLKRVLLAEKRHYSHTADNLERQGD
jgi:Leucine-rich repeat (LRR) protein